MRVKALESLLVDKGLVDRARSTRWRTYENEDRSAQWRAVVAQRGSSAYKKRLLTDATAAIASWLYGGQGEDMWCWRMRRRSTTS